MVISSLVGCQIMKWVGRNNEIVPLPLIASISNPNTTNIVHHRQELTPEDCNICCWTRKWPIYPARPSSILRDGNFILKGGPLLITTIQLSLQNRILGLLNITFC